MPTRESSSLERSGLRQARPAQEARRHLDEYVRRARLAGASWQVIGNALGITRQSAWERFRNLPGCAAKGTATSRLPRPPAQRFATKQDSVVETQKRVQRMRSAGASWQVIGNALGITRQSAWERFRNLPGCAAKGTATSRLPRPPAQRFATKQDSVVETQKRVQRMRSAGASWQVIGNALGITRQSAWERFRSICIYRKDLGIPEGVLQARHRQPHIFSAWVTEAAKADRSIEQWLEIPDINLGRMANFSRAVAPIELLDRDVLRNFLMASGHGDKARALSPDRIDCPVCNRSFLNKNFLTSHRKRDHRNYGTKA